MEHTNIMILNLPSPPGMDVQRDYSGGYGTAGIVRRNYYGHSGDVVFPVFMPYLASAIKKHGWRLSIVDGQAVQLDLSGTLESVENERPDFIVSLVSLPSIYGDLDLLDQIKKRLPDSVVVVVGTVVKTLADEILNKHSVDFLINAEYPFYSKPVINLVLAWQAGTLPTEKVVSTTYCVQHTYLNASTQNGESLDDLDVEIYREFPMDRYQYWFSGVRGEQVNYFPILSSKGCPFPCIYCPYPLGFGKTISYKSPGKLVDEMEFLRNEFGIKAFLFRDQVFTANRRRVEEICDLILARGLNVEWLFETRIDRITKDLLEKVRGAGCNRIHYGLETGDESFLQSIGKPGVEKKAVIEAFRNTKALGIRTVAHVIIGLPGETRKTLKNTYKFLGQLDPDNASWNMATPYPGTKLFDMAKENNFILTSDWTKYNTNQVVMRTESFTGQELFAIMKTFERKETIRKVIKRTRKALYDRTERRYVRNRLVHKLSSLIKV